VASPHETRVDGDHRRVRSSVCQREEHSGSSLRAGRDGLQISGALFRYTSCRRGGERRRPGVVARTLRRARATIAAAFGSTARRSPRRADATKASLMRQRPRRRARRGPHGIPVLCIVTCVAGMPPGAGVVAYSHYRQSYMVLARVVPVWVNARLARTRFRRWREIWRRRAHWSGCWR